MRKTFILYLVSLLIISQCELKAQVNLSNGLVGWYSFTGNPNDASGLGNNGTVSGATLATDRFGNPNSAYNFNGTTSYILTSFPGISGDNERTLNFWIKPDPSNTAYQYLGSYGASLIEGQDARFGLNFSSSSTVVVDISEAALAKQSPNLYDGNWHMITYVIPSGAYLVDVKFYVDGVQLTNTSDVCCFGKESTLKINTNTTSPGSSFNFCMGALRSNSTIYNYYKGLLDEVRIYNRSLNINEIKALYLESSVRLTENLVAYYPFNGNFKDYSNNGNNITTVIGTQFETNRYGGALNALSFAGGDNRVLAPSSPSLNSVTNGMSISLWINQTSANCPTCADQIPNYGYIILDKYEIGGTNGGYRLDARGKSGGLLTGKRTRFLAANSTIASIDKDGNVDYTLNNWHHIVVTYDLDSVKFFLDGVLTNKENAPLSTITSNNFNLAIGGPSDDSNNGTGFNFKGSMDEVRIYNRPISTQEVNALFNAYEVEIPTVCQPTTVTSIVQLPAKKFGFYTINSVTRDLIFVDTLGSITKIGNTQLGTNQWKYRGMDFDKTGNLYYLGQNDSLYKINYSTGKASFISILKDPNDNSYPNSIGFSFSPNGNLYILSPQGKLRKNLNLNSGLTTSIGSNLTGITSNLSLEFDDAGTLWTLDECCDGKLHKLSTATGVDIYDSPQSINQGFPSELDYSNGKLYGISILNESTSTVTTFYTVNTSTGSTTNLFTLSGIYFGLAGQIRKMYPDTVYITKHDTVFITKNQTVTVVSFVTVTGLNTEGERENSDIKAFPNPATNKLSVSSETGAVYSAELIDSKGVVVLISFSPSNIDLGDKAKGIYILKAKGYNGNVLKTFKVMIE